MIHETVEHALVRALGMSYPAAHSLAAAAEQFVLKRIGIQWAAYVELLREYYKPIEGDAELVNPPRDLALYAYGGRLYKTLWDFQQGKLAKQTTSYRQGGATQCADCENYRVKSHACTLVVGYINEGYTCDRWEPRPKTA
jgi:hypothetical protein